MRISTESPVLALLRRRTARLTAGPWLLALLCLTYLACGHKGPVLAPPLMHPATTYDLEIEQRGEELILTFTYPQTTISGLPLAELAKVEYWEVKKPVPEWVEPGAESEEDAAQASDATEDETGGEETTLQAEDPEDLEGIDEKDAEDQEGDEAEEDETEDEMPDEEPVAMTPPVPAPLPPTKEQIAAVEVLEFDATAQLKITLEGAELDAAIVGDKISLRIPFSEADREEETAFIYAVKTFADPRRGTGLSNLATLVRREPPAAPRDFEVEAEAGGVRVSWFNDKAVSLLAATGETPVATPVAQDPATDPALEDEEELEILAYRIYRRAAQARVYGLHIAEVMGTADEYVDRTAQYGNRYIYSLTGLALRLPLVQSALAGEAEVDYQDRFAPPVPRNVLAFAEPGRVRLLWDASPAPDLAGYIVFRRSAGGDFARLNVEPILDLEYNDRDVAAATEYEYRVAAADQIGNQSDSSVIIRARTP